MMNMKRKVSLSLASAAMIMQMFSGVAFGAISCTISGNGTDTDNTCDFATSRTVTVDQNNDMDVDNDVNIKAETGDNEAEDNTGGDVEIETGDVSADVTINTSGNTNTADVNSAGTSYDYEAEIVGNGTESDNDVVVNSTDVVDVDQYNKADVDNKVDVDASTGDNEAEDNTGGDVKISTGDVEVNDGVVINTMVNANSAVVGDSDHGGTIGVTIRGNGADSDNLFDLALSNVITLDQDNDADVDNDVDVDAETGDNEAEDNTGGESGIETGDVKVDVAIDTTANFNSAEVSDNYLTDVMVDIKKNGADTDNDFDLDLCDVLDVDQDNDLDVANASGIDVDGDTGGNEVEDSTNGDEDPMIETGDVEADVSISTAGNVNAYNGEANLQLDFDLSELVDLLSALSQLLGL